MRLQSSIRSVAASGRGLLPALLVLTAAPGLAAQNPGPAGSGVVLPIAVDLRLAHELGLRIGDTVEIGTAAESPGTRAAVTAIYQPPADPTTITRGEFRLRMHLPDLAALLGASDRVDRFGLALAPGVSPDSAAAALNAVAFGFRAYSSSEIASQSSQTFRVVSRFHRAIAVISIVASAVFLLCIMLLKVEERRLDAAVMRFVGIGRVTIFLSLLLEASMVAAVGSVAGVVLAEVAGSLTNRYYQHFFQTSLVFSLITPGIILFSVALSLGLGLIAGAIAALRLVHTRPLVLWGRG